MRQTNGIINHISSNRQRRENIRLAKFMGYNIDIHDDTGRVILYSETGKMIQHLGYGNIKKAWGRVKFDYHSSFDHLMTVVKRIEFLGFTVVSGQTYCTITTNNPEIENTVVINETAENRLDSIWLACVNFTKWYKNDK